VNLCRPSPVPLANFQFAQLRPVLWTGPPTPNFRKRKSEICLAEVVRVPRPTRKSTKCTNRGQGRAAPKERPQPSKFSKETCDCGNRSPPPYASPGAKPSSTPAVVLRPPSLSLRESPGRSLQVHPLSFCFSFPANRIGFAQTGFFGCMSSSCTGFFFDDRIITRKTRKSHRNTENIKNRLDWIHVVPSPAPTQNPRKRKSEICSAEVVRVPRPTRKSTEYTKRGAGVGCSKGAVSAEQVFEGNL